MINQFSTKLGEEVFNPSEIFDGVDADGNSQESETDEILKKFKRREYDLMEPDGTVTEASL